MTHLKIAINFCLITLVFCQLACTDKENIIPEPEPEKSAEKNIVSFKLSALSPEVVGNIDASSKIISLLVPEDTDVTALAPTIEVSDKAVVSPASGLAMDFTNTVKYTVIAEDATKQVYEVKVTVDPKVTIKENVGTLDLEQDGFLFIYGENFGADETKAKVILESTTSDNTIELEAIGAFFEATRIVVRIPEDAPLGDYKVKVVIDDKSVYMEETFTIVLHRPSIESVSPTTIIRGENITLTGKYFAASGNIVKLNLNQSSTTLQIVSESTTSIEVTIPSDQDVGEYTVSVTSNGKESFYNTEKIIVNKPSTSPEITSTSKTSYARGEVFTITGKNLKKNGVASNINFMPWPNGGTTIVRSAISNEDGTELTYTLPMDFPTGTYSIVVEVDFEFSDEYDQIIQITSN